MKRMLKSFILVLLFSVFTSVVWADKFIRDDATGGDCNSIGIWNSATKTCTLTTDLAETIQIEGNGVTLDGNRHKITGAGSGWGVFFSDKNGITVRNLNIRNFSRGIFARDSSYNSFINNNITSNTESGIYVYSMNVHPLVGNTFINNQIGSNGYRGIWVDYSNGATIQNNNIYLHSQYGILLWWLSSNNTVVGNTIHNNSYGVYLGYSSNNNIYNNNFIDNPTQAYVYGGSGNIFNLAAPTGGNYWGNYDTPSEGCNDTNNDGFCDTPYVFTGSQDNLPWRRRSGWEVPAPVPAIVDVKPDTLNKASQGDKNAVTVYIEILGYDVNAINVSTVTLNTSKGNASAQLLPTEVGDYDSDSVPDRMVKFNRQVVIAIVDIGERVKIIIRGKVGGTAFEGSDEVRVIEGKK